MRLVHLSDTHLGYSAYSGIDPTLGINQREADVYNAFRQAVDKAIELAPDVVVHAGDLFHKVRPVNNAIDVALKQLLRLSEEGIEVVLISGNHSTPRFRETGNIFSVFEHLKHIHPVHEPGCGKIVAGDLTIHAIPHSTTPSLSDVLSTTKPSGETSKNVLLLHAGVVGAETYRMDEFNEQTVSAQSLEDDWDYVALGHYHEFKEVLKKAYYSGSTERLSFTEAGQEKGIVEVDLDKGKVRLHPLTIRDMLDIPALDASGLSSSEIMTRSRDAISSQPIEDKIARFTIRNVASDAHRALDFPAIRRLGSSSLHFDLRIDRAEEEGKVRGGETQIGLLEDEFRKYVLALETSDDRKNKLLALGAPYLARGEE
ncbi:MAG TPA: exonuclease SbcCD subunit D [Thermoplasmata archaeon]